MLSNLNNNVYAATSKTMTLSSRKVDESVEHTGNKK